MTAYRCLVRAREGRSDWRVIDTPDQQSAVTRLVADGLTPLDVRSADTEAMQYFSVVY